MTEQERALPLESRCQLRLVNDARALEAAASGRMEVAVERFGIRVTAVRLAFPQVKTAFMNDRTKEVEIHSTVAVAMIHPNGGTGFPYPLGSPHVRMNFPSISDDALIPWVGGLHWFHEGTTPDYESLPPMVRELVALVASRHELRVGIPCLWRKGEWHLNRDLIFVARQIHRLLTDPGDYSPTDSMNPDAALYWAAHKDMLPMEPPIPELCRGSEKRASRHDRIFELTRVK